MRKLILNRRQIPLGAVCLFVVSLFTLSVLPGIVQAEDAQPSSRQILHRLSSGVTKFTLDNGLRVLFFKRSGSPVFSGQVWVRVGGVNEVPGLTGAAHLLEHMAFKGTTTVGTKDYEKEQKLLARYEELITAATKGEGTDLAQEFIEVQKQLEALWVPDEFSRLYQERGAAGLNAGTAKDYTMYTVNLPSVALEFWCWMESERIFNPVFRQFYKELEVVKEERRMRTDNDPTGRVYEALLSTAYWNHPNRLPVIGWPSDLEQLRTSDVMELHQDYYRPDNMVVSIVGDLDVEVLQRLMKKYFGRLTRPAKPIPTVRAVEEPQRGERRSLVEFDAEPQVMAGFHKPAFPHPDDMHFAVLHSLLDEGRSSVFQKEIVQQKQLATSVYTTEAPGELYPALFIIGGTPSKGVSADKLLEELQKILDRFKTEPVKKEQLVAAKKRVKKALLASLTSNGGLARTLAHTELLWGDWEKIFSMYDQILATSEEDIMRISREYLRVENRTRIELQRASTKLSAPENGTRKSHTKKG